MGAIYQEKVVAPQGAEAKVPVNPDVEAVKKALDVDREKNAKTPGAKIDREVAFAAKDPDSGKIFVLVKDKGASIDNYLKDDKNQKPNLRLLEVTDGKVVEIGPINSYRSDTRCACEDSVDLIWGRQGSELRFVGMEKNRDFVVSKGEATYKASRDQGARWQNLDILDVPKK